MRSGAKIGRRELAEHERKMREMENRGQRKPMAAMWHFADLSALYSLIGATVGETIAYCAYAAKSARENTEGGIVHDMAMKEQEGNGEAQEGPENEAKG